MADEAICIGPPPSTESYLVMNKVIDSCLQTGAQAVSLYSMTGGKVISMKKI